MRKVVFDEEKAKRLRDEGMSYSEIAKHINGVSRITIFKRLNPIQEKLHNERCKKTRQERKACLIKLKGGKCCMPGCGYNKCHASLVFHHLEPEKKSFGIGDRKFAPFEELLKEADKTILVCSNCHGEVHEGLHDEFINNLLKKV
jgi:hypothetical protein|tara:strand:+ start:455 stop:889 length:435 start_codon:yes stop_codon:yes gene_type:complete